MEYSRLKTERGVLLLLDDMITDTKAFNKCSGNLLNELAFMGRHHKVSFILTTQSYTSIQRPIRINTSAVIAFNLKNKREEQAFLEEQSMWENIKDLYTVATSPKYGFLCLNKETGKAYSNFERILQ
jgi:DNA helicase HerA-like ATPase